MGFGVAAWRQRWMCDDGLIVLRTVRNLLAGNGPVFNAGERVETNTSALWTALLTLAGLVPGVSLPVAAVVLGLVLSTGGLLLAMDATRRLHQAAGPTVVLPAGALLLCVLPPFQDFATSGLETGLIMGWMGLGWWLLVRIGMAAEPSRGAQLATAFVLGLGPLVRPDLAVFAAALLLAAAVLVRPGWLGLLGLGAAAAALPVAYQVFRMGYYGLPVPSAALAKEATVARWAQGWSYLHDLVAPYWLWLPVVLLLAALALALSGRATGHRQLVLALTPIVAAIALALYTVRVGGDFMHGRMLLPALFALLLPVLVLPVLALPVRQRLVLVAVTAVLVWAVVAAGWLRVPYGSQIDAATGITDERAFYIRIVGHEHPITPADHSAQLLPAQAVQRVAELDRHVVLLLDHRSGKPVWREFATRHGVDHSTIVLLVIGVTAGLAPLDVRVVDPVGLANPIARHSDRIPNGRIGHDKDLAPEWYLADEADLSQLSDVNWPQIDAARVALACPRRQEMLDSVRAPLTWDRFRRNFTGAVQRSRLRYSPIPAAAVPRCGLP